MKTKTLAFISMLGIAGTFASCSASSDELGKPEKKETGTLFLNLKETTSFTDATRALSENDYKNTDNYNVQILDTKGNIKVEGLASELRFPMTLDLGSYNIVASYGNESAVSRNDFYVYGISAVNITADKSVTAEITCTPTCGKISVAFSSDMATYFTDYNVSFGGTSALSGSTFNWSKTDSEPWYAKLNEDGETITFTISTTTNDNYGSDYDDDGNAVKTETKTGSFKLQRNKAYKLNIKPNAVDSQTTGAIKLEITIDETTNDIEKNIEVPISWI